MNNLRLKPELSFPIESRKVKHRGIIFSQKNVRDLYSENYMAFLRKKNVET